LSEFLTDPGIKIDFGVILTIAKKNIKLGYVNFFKNYMHTRRKKNDVFHATKTLIKRNLNAGKTRYKRT